jgi:hypothetical protein
MGAFRLRFDDLLLIEVFGHGEAEQETQEQHEEGADEVGDHG